METSGANRALGRRLGYAVVIFALLLVAACDWPRSRSGKRECPPDSIVAFGDSITYGAGLARDETYPAILSLLLNQPVCNAGINGDTAPKGLARLESDVLRQRPATVLILFGANDSGIFGPSVPIETYRDDLRAIVQRVSGSGAQPVLLSLVPVDAARMRAAGYQPELLTPYDAVVRNLARELDVPLIDLAPAFGADTSLFLDGVHPNSRGAALIAHTVAASLDSIAH